MLTTVASSSRRAAPRLVRAASTATAPLNPNLPPDNAKLDVIRASLYPPNSVAPNSSSPVGARHAHHEIRLEAAIPSAEAHETVERAWALYRRRERLARDDAMRAKFNAMVDACDELDQITAESGDRRMYDRAMTRMNHGNAAYQATLEFEGQKKSLRSQWAEARPEGLVPRETWIPTETRGRGWKYEWTRPKCEFCG